MNAARFLGRKAQPWSLSQRIYVYAEGRDDGRITIQRLSRNFMAVPARARIRAGAFAARARRSLERFEAAKGRDIRVSRGKRAALDELDTARLLATTPLQRIEHTLHPYVAFGIMWADSWPDCTWSGCFCREGAATVSTRASGATTGNPSDLSGRERGGEAQAFSWRSTHFSTRIG